MKLKEANQEEISLQTGHDSFLAFLRYLYTETLPTEDIQTLLELLALSNLYQVSHLVLLALTLLPVSLTS